MTALEVGLKLNFGLENEAANMIIRLPQAAVDRFIGRKRSASLSF
jgi:hypothetical protein